MSTRWVKTDENGQTKERLVVRGFQQKGKEIQKDSPTLRKRDNAIHYSTCNLDSQNY